MTVVMDFRQNADGTDKNLCRTSHCRQRRHAFNHFARVQFHNYNKMSEKSLNPPNMNYIQSTGHLC